MNTLHYGKKGLDDDLHRKHTTASDSEGVSASETDKTGRKHPGQNFVPETSRQRADFWVLVVERCHQGQHVSASGCGPRRLLDHLHFEAFPERREQITVIRAAGQRSAQTFLQ